MKIIDMSGNKYRRLTAISHIPGSSRGAGVMWAFRCDCGKEIVANGRAVRRGNITECSTCASESRRKARTTHGMTNSDEYRIWEAMRRRCYNENSVFFERYGGRGIEICKEWMHSFEAFFNDMGPRPSSNHTIDRINNDAGYSHDNCRWATHLEQANNKSNNNNIKIDGKVKTLAQWSREYGLNESTIRGRIKRGVSGSGLIAKRQME